MKFAVLSASIAIALMGASSAAAAAPCGAAPLQACFKSTQVIDLDQTDIFGKTYKNLPAGGGRSFLDTYTFTISSLADVDGSLTSFATKAAVDVDIRSFELFQGTTLVASALDKEDGAHESWVLESVKLAAGDYSLKIGGVLGSSGGSYSGTINVSPVPEPSTWAMMGIGLLAAGVMARRRK